MTSLPHDVGRLAARIRRSIETFAGELPRSQQGFLFVLEDTALARVVGVSAIEVAVGLDEPFYNFRIQKRCAPRKRWESISPRSCLISAMTTPGIVELCTLFLDPAYQRNRNGLLLSRRAFYLSPPFASGSPRTCLPNCAAAAMSRDSRRSGMRWAIISSTSRSPMPTG
ncbi:arginine N-succinyltransferase [Klebsiella pneumoniae subsp. pneumoniae]|nr:arginine N-succinyltransferase [Klebsiella pneumoniae subsp. pneumoniae]